VVVTSLQLQCGMRESVVPAGVGRSRTSILGSLFLSYLYDQPTQTDTS
jgi:hypothetical protein